MQANSDVIPGSHIPHDFQIPPGVKMTGGPITIESKRYSSSQMNPVNKGSASTSDPPHPRCLLNSQSPSTSQQSAKNPKRQKKGRVFTEDQKQVLQEHFAKCKYLKKQECMAIAQRLGIDEHHIKIWFKNRRARAKPKEDSEVHVNPAYPGPVEDPDSKENVNQITASKTSPESSTNATGMGLETKSPDVILAEDNDRASSASQDELFIEKLCELEDSLGNLSPPDFFEHFSLVDFF